MNVLQGLHLFVRFHVTREHTPVFSEFLSLLLYRYYNQFCVAGENAISVVLTRVRLHDCILTFKFRYLAFMPVVRAHIRGGHTAPASAPAGFKPVPEI